MLKKFLFVFTFTFFLLNSVCLADDIIRIDGKFSDWENKPIYVSNKTSASYICEGHYAYVYLGSKSVLPKELTLKLGSDNSATILLPRKGSMEEYTGPIYSKLLVHGSITKIQCYKKSYRNGRQQIEMRIPLKKISSNLSNSITMRLIVESHPKINITTGEVSTLP